MSFDEPSTAPTVLVEAISSATLLNQQQRVLVHEPATLSPIGSPASASVSLSTTSTPSSHLRVRADELRRATSSPQVRLGARGGGEHSCVTVDERLSVGVVFAADVACGGDGRRCGRAGPVGPLPGPEGRPGARLQLLLEHHRCPWQDPPTENQVPLPGVQNQPVYSAVFPGMRTTKAHPISLL